MARHPVTSVVAHWTACWARGRLAPCLLFGLALTGCGESEVQVRLDDVRTGAASDRPAAPAGFTEEQRFGAAAGSPHGGGAMGAPAPARPTARWKFVTPEGWSELPPAPLRDHGWKVGTSGKAECTLSLLSGPAGGLEANVSRWRKQMSMPPSEPAGLAQLPKLAWLGVEARGIELDGAYRGMGAEVLLPEARLLGRIAVLPSGTVFLKLVGPVGVVAVERARFDALADSLTLELGAPSELPAGHPSPAAAAPAPKAARLAWTAPEGWVQQPPRMMREVTYSPAAAPAVSVYVSVLVGTAGGTRANVDRWRGEMGQAPCSDAEFEALPRGTVLGGSAVFVDLEGTFAGMGGQPAPGSGMLGMVLERTQGSVFVKMTGPAAEVQAERARFRAFCESLRE